MKCETIQCESACESSCGGRSFLTKEERIQKLNKYKEWLDNESNGVQEKIEDLKKAS